LLSFVGKPVVAADDLRIAVDAALADTCIDGLYIAYFLLEPENWKSWTHQSASELAALRHLGQIVTVTASSGAGVLLAVEAGLTAGGPVSTSQPLISLLRKGRKIGVDPTTTVVECPGLLTTSGLAGEAALGLRLIERVITPHLARVLAREISAPLTVTSAVDDPFAVPILHSDDLVVRACERIRAEFSKSIDLQAFASDLGVSPRTLTRRFQVSLGMGPKAYQQHLRLASAQSMLARTTRPVVRIAAMVGYADPAYFVSLFRSRLGETPSEFRTRARASSHP